MAEWKLHVEELGKIKSADIKISPLTLFVGDNNSGKSYLMTLIWGIYAFGFKDLFDYDKIDECEEWETFSQKILDIFSDFFKNIYNKDDKKSYKLYDIKNLMENIINFILERNKDRFIRNIFNYENITIGKLSINFFEDKVDDELIIYRKDDLISIFYGDVLGYLSEETFKKVFEEMLPDKMTLFVTSILYMFIGNILDISRIFIERNDQIIFLPAARTGFMLTRNIINSFSRKQTFDIFTEKASSFHTFTKPIQPFTKPINQFLDIMDNLSTDISIDKEREAIIDYIEKDIIYGQIGFNNTTKEVKYSLDENNAEIPLRVSSAVVSELSPIILLLKYRNYIDRMFYEEPEMCLHPQLQKKIARLLCMLVKADIPVIATTHSDIIIQHINNIIRLNLLEQEQKDNICKRFGYSDKEIISRDDITIYQFTEDASGYTKVESIDCTEYGFEVRSFNDALDKILDEVYEIQQ